MILLVETVAPHAAIIAERLRANVAALPENQAGSPVTISIGVAQLEPGQQLDALLNHADQALLEAKHAGRNRVKVIRV